MKKERAQTSVGSEQSDEFQRLVAAERTRTLAAALPGCLIGLVVDARHPTLQGRALVRWSDGAGASCERWLPLLLAVTARPGDRVLLLQPSNSEEPVAIGVVDGFAERPQLPRGGPRLELLKDEALKVVSPDGQELLEISQGERGPVVRLLGAATEVELPGTLKLSAERIELRARRGEVAIEASDDVVVTGATIKLN